VKVIDIQPKDIQVLIELSITEIDELSLALSKSKVVCSKEEEKTIKVTLDKFFFMIGDVLTGLKDDKKLS